MKREVIVVGGGAAGMVAAIAAASEGARVTILEHKEKVGKKILATGNGKCNYTNLYQSMECYRSENLPFVQEVFSHFNEKDTIAFFQKLGIVPKAKNGYLYPGSEQASSIVDVLTMELKHLKVEVRCNEDVTKIIPTKEGYHIQTLVRVLETRSGAKQNGKNKKKEKAIEVDSYVAEYDAKKVIIATGGRASEKLGSNGSGYRLLKEMGYGLVPVVPALVQLKAKGADFEQVAGVRCDANITLLVDGEKVAQEEGELQLTNYGVSGIPVFQVSRYAAKALYDQKKVTMEIDFLPQFGLDELGALLCQRYQESSYKTDHEVLIGLMNDKLITLLLNKAKNIDPYGTDCKRLAKRMKQFTIEITDTNGFDNAQICAGGMDTTELAGVTMESKKHSGFYIVGEVLDVDGICGGYNLQWAWATGYLAGKAAGKKLKLHE
ncbi:BaiN/RdsA family NAD(P)/FAD-dependent oxidoreductase [Anaerosporobacter faecicola]|uniref:NAD(P)/FAD-dependent oxidoreductase n=1 Tax=Anaerosporobacter faecicola TaxID=2718714 RepID=UPI001EE621FE|nr:NAD(P)/FAD-dependent oxidoreductase [Anaerosporobacter faecicola]